MSQGKRVVVSLLFGFSVAFASGIVVMWLNQVFFQGQYAESWRLIVWTLGMGTLFSIELAMILTKRKERVKVGIKS